MVGATADTHALITFASVQQTVSDHGLKTRSLRVAVEGVEAAATDRAVLECANDGSLEHAIHDAEARGSFAPAGARPPSYNEVPERVADVRHVGEVEPEDSKGVFGQGCQYDLAESCQNGPKVNQPETPGSIFNGSETEFYEAEESLPDDDGSVQSDGLLGGDDPNLTGGQGVTTDAAQGQREANMATASGGLLWRDYALLYRQEVARSRAVEREASLLRAQRDELLAKLQMAQRLATSSARDNGRIHCVAAEVHLEKRITQLQGERDKLRIEHEIEVESARLVAGAIGRVEGLAEATRRREMEVRVLRERLHRQGKMSMEIARRRQEAKERDRPVREAQYLHIALASSGAGLIIGAGLATLILRSLRDRE